jgi:hypothetical protein
MSIIGYKLWQQYEAAWCQRSALHSARLSPHFHWTFACLDTYLALFEVYVGPDGAMV